MVRLQYAFQYMTSNRSVKSADCHGNLPTELKYKLERIMIKEYGNVRKRTKKNTDRLSHIKVYRDEEKTSKRYTFFNVEFCAFSNFFAFTFSEICKEKQADEVLIRQGVHVQFTVSCRAVLRAWIFEYPTPVSSALLLVLHRRHRRFLWHSCVLLSGSDYSRSCRAQHCIPKGLNRQWGVEFKISFFEQ